MKFAIGDKVKILGEQFPSFQSVGKDGVVIGTNKQNFLRPHKVHVYTGEDNESGGLPDTAWPVNRCLYYEYSADELELKEKKTVDKKLSWTPIEPNRMDTIEPVYAEGSSGSSPF